MDILELTLKSDNLAETKLFYNTILGFEIAEENETQISFRIGKSKLVFESTDKKYKYHFAFNIPNNKLNEAVTWVSERTKLIPINDTEFIVDFTDWNAKAIYFLDNNKNIVEFISREELHNPSDLPFSGNSILNINEIGLVSDHPITTVFELIKTTNIGFFAKGPKRDDFAAAGDENGLFVISNPKRCWYPTQELAETCKVKAKVKIAGNSHVLEFN
ncbi:MAG: hypothetical protein QM534_18930 [Sediminibacterium sp.]|nr:hypothetical protein [Sediminibacterium sp.]